MLYRIQNERVMKRYDKKNETNTSRYRKYKSKGIKKETSVITLQMITNKETLCFFFFFMLTKA